MRRLPLLLVLAILSALNVAPQSGRRITTTASTTPPAPIQPPLNPQPEIKTGPAPLTSLLRLPDSAWERQIKAFDDKNFRLGDFHGKVVVINLWASWCGPCRREVPEYERVRKAYPNGDVVFIGLTAEDPRRDNTRVRRFVREVSFGFRLGWIDEELMRTLSSGSGTIPQTLVMNRDGRIISHWDGYMSGGHSGERLKQTIEQALRQD